MEHYDVLKCLNQGNRILIRMSGNRFIGHHNSDYEGFNINGGSCSCRMDQIPDPLSLHVTQKEKMGCEQQEECSIAELIFLLFDYSSDSYETKSKT